MSKFLYYASLAVILHVVQFLFTGVAMWSQIQPDGVGAARAAGLFALHVGAIAYAVAYALGEIE